VTDEEVDEAALRASQQGPLDILVTHGCPSGVADLTLRNQHGGQRCFLRAFQVLRPKVYLTGHLHRAQQYVTKEGQIVRNVGETPRGDATLLTANGAGVVVEARPFRTKGA
jgi:hypothetical protein